MASVDGSAFIAALVALQLLVFAPASRAQDIEPRAYSNAPIGVNFLIAGYARTRGGLSLDPSLPITDPLLKTSNAVVGYARVIELWGQSAKVDVVLPYTWLSGTALYKGDPVERTVDGAGDASFRLSVNFLGAPALRLPEFARYEQDVIVGASLRVTAPTGQYDNTRLVNVGSHRWTIRPEVGVSKASGPWTAEVKAAVAFYTDNTDFYGGSRRSQGNIYSAGFHVVRSFANGMWASLDTTYFGGGRSTIDGARANDLQQNWRVGGTLAIPVDRLNSVKLYASSGVSDRTGNDFDLVGIAWQHRWGGGL
ncbi:MAG: transporter [Betaproteobacteria bacterium]|nr:transporter [Betaproteobacteria bacterium]